MPAAPAPAIFVLRPQPGADRTRASLAALGLDAGVHPLTRIAALGAEAPDGAFDAIVFSSQNGVRHGAAALAGRAGLDAFCVGAMTARAARARGFAVAHVEETAARLVPAIAAAGRRAVLYACGRVRRPDLEQGLARAAIACVPLECYDAIPVEGAPDSLADSIAAAAAAGLRPVVLAHAPSAAALLAPVAARLAAAGTTAVCLSDAVAAALPAALRVRASIAVRPDEEALRERLAALFERPPGDPLPVAAGPRGA